VLDDLIEMLCSRSPVSVEIGVFKVLLLLLGRASAETGHQER
jgi:hypothetical protein